DPTLPAPQNLAGVAAQHKTFATILGAPMNIHINIQPALARRELTNGPMVNSGLQSAPRTAFEGMAPFEFAPAIDAYDGTQAMRVFGGEENFGPAIAVKIGRLWTPPAVPS